MIEFSGYYMYIETSAKAENEKAFLQTYPMPANDYCIDLNYHMHGVSMVF